MNFWQSYLENKMWRWFKSKQIRADYARLRTEFLHISLVEVSGLRNSWASPGLLHGEEEQEGTEEKV